MMKYELLVILSFLISLSSFGQQKLQYKFVEQKNYYAFEASFELESDLECLLKTIYDFKYLKTYSDAADKVEMKDSGYNWYEVLFLYRKYNFLENESIWLRTYSPEDFLITFSLKSNTSKPDFLPVMLSSNGYYKLSEYNGKVVIKYFQDCKVSNHALSRFYLMVAKKEALNFIKDFSKLLNETCPKL